MPVLRSYGKPKHTTDKTAISRVAPLHHLQRFGCWEVGELLSYTELIAGSELDLN